MPERSLLASFVVVALLAVGACGDDGAATRRDGGRFVALDGSPRVPDDAGVVTSIDPDFATLVLDGEAVYEIHEQVQSFASLDGSTLPLRARVGQYVHVGLDGDTVIWVAAIGSVLRLEDQPETVMYLGSIVDVDREAGRIALRDGTVLRISDRVDLGRGLADVTDPVPATLRIDVATDSVVDVELAT